jgi:hypothetical protein
MQNNRYKHSTHIFRSIFEHSSHHYLFQTVKIILLYRYHIVVFLHQKVMRGFPFNITPAKLIAICYEDDTVQ